ncbi:class Ib ribonucleoside-diphosphate reductase assembly flavoprotein NrdI [Gulosibacter sp. ACHW.36C]|uniref:Protein NrdI n=1 Tax=Gulosibacter sediminis TaxID=1729695 RepID=A0ABY4MYY3_9MICO|nr:class Ib ribonucleoside-diphosphate reductase assembly flavoprotein NrdI [Gulosibacter sediminis]UQN15651.1 class Ib ribonucleoside-diphosphate reductase assembly flavoprotein NrdI [Gulosibacter sediminis]
MSGLVYFSSASGNTHRFLTKLGREARRIPLFTYEPTILADEPYVLIVPTYGGGTPKTAVPKQVIKFLNLPENRELLRGVIGAGNTNFGRAYGLAADVIAAKCQVPVLYRFELFGTPEDVQNVNKGLDQFWQQQPTLATT